MDRFGPSLLALAGGLLIAAQAPINALRCLVVGSPRSRGEHAVAAAQVITLCPAGTWYREAPSLC